MRTAGGSQTWLDRFSTRFDPQPRLDLNPANEYEICIAGPIMNEYQLQDFLETSRSFSASFSPDGKSLAFLRSDRSGVAQIYLVQREGGDPQQLTSYSEPIGDLAFSPTNGDLLFSMAEGGNERFQLYLLNLDTRTTERLTNNDEAIYRFG